MTCIVSDLTVLPAHRRVYPCNTPTNLTVERSKSANLRQGPCCCTVSCSLRQLAETGDYSNAVKAHRSGVIWRISKNSRPRGQADWQTLTLWDHRFYCNSLHLMYSMRPKQWNGRLLETVHTDSWRIRIFINTFIEKNARLLLLNVAYLYKSPYLRESCVLTRIRLWQHPRQYR